MQVPRKYGGSKNGFHLVLFLCVPESMLKMMSQGFVRPSAKQIAYTFHKLLNKAARKLC